MRNHGVSRIHRPSTDHRSAFDSGLSIERSPGCPGAADAQRCGSVGHQIVDQGSHPRPHGEYHPVRSATPRWPRAKPDRCVAESSVGHCRVRLRVYPTSWPRRFTRADRSTAAPGRTKRWRHGAGPHCGGCHRCALQDTEPRGLGGIRSRTRRGPGRSGTQPDLVRVSSGRARARST